MSIYTQEMVTDIQEMTIYIQEMTIYTQEMVTDIQEMTIYIQEMSIYTQEMDTDTHGMATDMRGMWPWHSNYPFGNEK